ncbi:hypothetical protein OIU77_007561 [Salix suchowensis]|uniref:Uncharacterized protein n=1 Tax=Salix suchowensis TaxID=1278906 RepID=A0ABQ9AGP6_9ROSI|nr:hypothetical protein OIU77_007561 [Salix suchowensis]
MFGRVRVSSSSLDSLERPSSKILKDDSLSIYEATLMKLKLGSHRDQSSPFEETVDMENSDRSSATDQLSFSSMQSTGDSKDQRSRNVSVLFLFSKYTNSRQALTPSGELARCNLIAGNCSTSTYASCSNSRSPGISKEQSEHECLSSSSACQM